MRGGFSALIRLVGAVALAGACSNSAGVRLVEDAGTVPADGGTTDAGVVAGPPAIYLQFDDSLPPATATRVRALVALADSRPVQVVARDWEPDATTSAESLILAAGDVAVTRKLLARGDVSALGPEGFALRSGTVAGINAIATDGNPPAPGRFGHGNLGAAYGAYAALEALGFGFLHPLAPVIPRGLVPPPQPLVRDEKPRWPMRGIHLHTMHPTELTDLLEGWGPNGPDDEAGFRAMLPEWTRALDWMVANRENEVDWLLLEAASWEAFAEGDVRRERLKLLVQMAQDAGLSVGLDVPIAEAQQHAYRLITKQGDLADEQAQLDARLSWLLGAGYDFVLTEPGTSEFTHSDAARSLAWMNELARTLDEDHGGKRAYMKAHTSTGQVADGFVDPETGAPLNYNFLPHYADPRLGVLPHTLQTYAPDDPSPTYGNADFSHIRRFAQLEAGLRPTLWHPETAYWVSFDIDVPLHLPLYGERRVHDLLLLAGDERAGRMGRGAHANARMDGQIVFSSGWEWGYWLNDVVAARAAWNPHEEAADAYAAILDEVLKPFGSTAWRDLLVDTARAEKKLLIDGEVNGVRPANVALRNGHAYLAGFDAWDDVPKLAAQLGVSVSMTQPDRVGLVDLRNPLRGAPSYDAEVAPLLAAMEDTFGALATRYATLAGTAPAGVKDLAAELADAAAMTALRAKQVHGLYDYVGTMWTKTETERLPMLQRARGALDAAQLIATAREAHYRVPADRLAAWRPGPTAYEYRSLWTVRRLAWWWRDEGKAVDAPRSPCYLNTVNPVDVGFGEGPGADAVQLVHDIESRTSAFGSLTECLGAPAAEPVFPQDGLRARP